MSGARHKPNRERISELWHQGQTLVDIGKTLGISKGLVRYHTTEMGLQRQKVVIDEVAFARMWKAGATYAQIKAELNIPNGSITNHASRLGLPLRKGKDGGLTRSANGGPRRADWAEVCRMYQAGDSAASIAARLQISRSHVHKILRDTEKEEAPEMAATLVADAAPVTAAPSMPPHPFWTPDRDFMVLITKGQHAALSALARALDRPITDVQLRWHRLRAA